MFEFLFSTANAQFTNTASATGSKTQEGITTFFTTIADKFPSWIAGLIVIFLAFIVASITKKMVINKVAEHLEEDNQSVLILIGRTTYVGVLSIGLAIGLSFWGFRLDTLLAAFGIGVAFALRDIMVNFIAGVLILVSRQFRIGDFIQVGSSIKGKVEEIQARATILKGFDGTKIIVPNKDIFNKEVISFTTNPFRRIIVVVGVDYRTNLGLATKLVTDLLKDRKYVLTVPKPQVVIDAFADSSINLKVKFWVESKSPWVKVKSKVIHDIQKRFQEASISIPWPIRTVVYDKDSPAGPGKKPDHAPTSDSKPVLAAQAVAVDRVNFPLSALPGDAAIPATETVVVENDTAASATPNPSPVFMPELPKSEDSGTSFLKQQ